MIYKILKHPFLLTTTYNAYIGGLCDSKLIGPWRVLLVRTEEEFMIYFYHEEETEGVEEFQRQAKEWLEQEKGKMK